MPRATPDTIKFLTDYFATMEAKNIEALGDFYAEDITFTFANGPTVTGRTTVLNQMVTLLGKVDSLAHPLINVWEEDEGVVVLEVGSAWRFHDGVETLIKACSIFTIADGRFADQRIYVDNSSIDAYLA